MKILLFSLEDINNAGDELLRVTTQFIISMDFPTTSMTQIQLKPKFRHIPVKFKLEYFIGNIVKCISLKMKGDMEYRFRNWAYKIQYYRYFSSVIAKADKIILPVGMLKYSTQHFSYIFHLINKLATKHGKSVMMSAMSIEKPNIGDWRFRQLRDAVNFPSCKIITSRDGILGVEILENAYIVPKSSGNRIILDYVGDPALWVADCFNIKKNLESKLVGINLIRTGIYRDYGNNVSSDDLYNLYKEVVTYLLAHGYEFRLFCNGIAADYEVGVRLVHDLSLPPDILLPPPSSGRELVEIIAGFSSVFAARLHACIISVALNVPVAGLLWDNKLLYFSRTMGIEPFFSSERDLKADLIINKLERAMLHHLDIQNRDMYKQRFRSYIDKFLNEEVK